MQQCSNCGHQNRAGVVFCENCGASLIGKLPRDTKSLEASSEEEKKQIILESGILKDVKVQGIGTFQEGDSLKLEIEGGAEPIALEPKAEAILGRRDPATGAMPDVDLTPYAGYRMGVSRRHAAIRRSDDNTLNLWDLGSSNGTFLNGQRLSAHRPYQLHDGDEVRLGQMTIRIQFQPAAKAEAAPSPAPAGATPTPSPIVTEAKPPSPPATTAAPTTTPQPEKPVAGDPKPEAPAVSAAKTPSGHKPVDGAKTATGPLSEAVEPAVPPAPKTTKGTVPDTEPLTKTTPSSPPPAPEAKAQEQTQAPSETTKASEPEKKPAVSDAPKPATRPPEAPKAPAPTTPTEKPQPPADLTSPAEAGRRDTADAPKPETPEGESAGDKDEEATE